MTAPPDLRDALIACLAERFNRLPGQCGGHADALIDGPLAGLISQRECLLIAFHEAIRRPLDVTPDSGAEFYDPRIADVAKARRSSASVSGGNPANSAAGRLVQSTPDAGMKERGGDR